MNPFVINGLAKRRAELADDIEITHETVSLDAIASEAPTMRDIALQLISGGSPRRRQWS
jgi:hypothetical protein